MARVDVTTLWTLAVAFAMTLMGALNPPFQAPDEPMHLARAALRSGIRGTETLQSTEHEILGMLPRFRFWRYVRFPAPRPPLTRSQF